MAFNERLVEEKRENKMKKKKRVNNWHFISCVAR